MSLTRSIRAVLPIKSVRNLSSTPSKEFKPRTISQLWLSDTGAYPVMGVIAFACVFSVGSLFYLHGTDVDIRVKGVERKAPFRGDMRKISTKGEEFEQP